MGGRITIRLLHFCHTCLATAEKENKCWYNWLPVCQREVVDIQGGVGEKKPSVLRAKMNTTGYVLTLYLSGDLPAMID